MKKLISILLAFACCLTPIALFAGCGENDKYWEVSYKSITDFFADENYQFVINDEYLTYSAEVDAQIEADNVEYTNLKEIYNYSLNSSMKMFVRYKDSLQIKPINSEGKQKKEIKKSFTEFDKEFEKFKTNCTDFYKKYETFKTEVTQNLDESFAQQKLKDFKRVFYTLVQSSISLNEKFETLYRISYQDIFSQTTEISGGVEKVANSLMMLKYTKIYISVELGQFEGLENSKYTTLAGDIKNCIDNLNSNFEKTASTELETNFKTWISRYSIFENETANFYKALDNISLKTLVEEYNGNIDNYCEDNKDKTVYCNTYDDFKTTISTLFLNYTQKLFA